MGFLASSGLGARRGQWLLLALHLATCSCSALSAPGQSPVSSLLDQGRGHSGHFLEGSPKTPDA